jgi:hypothetical protein
LFGFVRFLSPLPSDLNQIGSKIDLPHFTVQRLLSDTFSLSLFSPLRSRVFLSGRLIYRAVLSRDNGIVLGSVFGDVLKVRRVVFVRRAERGKYEVLGGYISPSAVLSVAGDIIEVDVRSWKASLVMVHGWKFGEVL